MELSVVLSSTISLYFLSVKAKQGCDYIYVLAKIVCFRHNISLMQQIQEKAD